MPAGAAALRQKFLDEVGGHRAVRGSDDTLPRFHLRIEGKTVRLDYAGAKAIEFAPDALGLPADASFMINGETVSPDPAAPKRPLGHPAPRQLGHERF